MTRQEPPWLARLFIRLAAHSEDRPSVERDLREEFWALLEQGHTPNQARSWYRRQVLGSLGPLLWMRVRGLHTVKDFFGSEGGMWRDARMAVRTLLKRPGFSAIVVGTLALGIGATSAVFTLIEGVLLTPPPYEDPDRLVLVTPTYTDGQEGTPNGWAAEQWMEWKEDSESFQSLTAYLWTFTFAISDEGSESLEGMWVSPDYFETTRLEPVIGRVFSPSDTYGPDADPVIVIGHDFWMRQYNGDPGVLGQTIRLARTDTPPTVIGVMPPGVRFLPDPGAAQEPNYDVNAGIDFWRPAVYTRDSDPDDLAAPIWKVLGRLADGVSPEVATAEVGRANEVQIQRSPEYEGIAARLVPVMEVVNGESRRILFPLLAAAGLVLLIACGNAASLLLVRGLQKKAEYAIRGAMGANRGALLRLVALESLILAAVGGGLGIALAVVVVSGFKSIGTYAIPRLDSVSVGGGVVLFGIGCALLATLIAGVYPAIRASRRAEGSALNAVAGSRATAGLGERRLLTAVSVLQAALTLTLFVGAGLLMRTMANLASVDSGFDLERVVTMSFTNVEGGDYVDVHGRALESVLALPGVEHAAYAWGVPMTGNNWPASFAIEGVVLNTPDERISLPLRSVTPGYFTLLGQGIVEGRDFSAADDREGDQVAVVNEAFVDRYLGGATAVGRQLFRGPDRVPVQIVGVVSDGRTDDLTLAAEPEVYASLWQASAFSKHLVVRTAGPGGPTPAAIRRAVLSAVPTVAIENPKSLEQIRGESLASRTFAMRLLVGFAVVASILTLGGIYGVLSLSVASRRREIAIRTALGATKRSTLGLILGEGSRVVLAGLVLGLMASIFLGRVLSAFLFGVAPTDPTTLAATALVFCGVALMACFVPARRAARLDPVEVLRES